MMDSTENGYNAVEYDPEKEVYRARFEQGSDTPSIAIVKAIAAIEGIDPTTLDPLGDTIDMDALDAVVQPPMDNSDIQVTFPIQGYQVSIHSGGEIELQPIDSGTASRGTE